MRRFSTPRPLVAAVAWLIGSFPAVAGAAEEGVPMSFKTDLAIWSLVVFLLFVFVLKKFAWGPLSAGLDAREQRIREDIASAESARERAEAMLADHEAKLAGVQEEVKEILAEELPDIPVSISFDVMPKWKEYERASTTTTARDSPLISRLRSGK